MARDVKLFRHANPKRSRICRVPPAGVGTSVPGLGHGAPFGANQSRTAFEERPIGRGNAAAWYAPALWILTYDSMA